MIQTKPIDNQCVYTFQNPRTGGLMDKHWEFYKNSLAAAAGKNKYRRLFFGGGVNGGKTYAVLFTIQTICKLYPFCKIYVIRRDLPSLKKTTIESAAKLWGQSGRWVMASDNPRFEFKNGSKVYFMAESFDRDKQLNRFLGLEASCIFLEQLEELQEFTFNKCIERVGRWKHGNKPMPKPLIFSTFNPTGVKWVRDKIYVPYQTDKIPEDMYLKFITVLDNPFATDDELENLKKLPSLHYRMMVEGDWDALPDDNRFIYSFDRSIHLSEIAKYHYGEDVYISIDFNVDPMCCLLAHKNDDTLLIFKELRINNSDVYEICDKISEICGGSTLFITGDASGNSRSVTVRDGMSAYQIICNELNITRHCIHVPTRNLGIRDSRQITNAALEQLQILINPDCEYLIEDILTVRVDKNGQIDKVSDKMKTHLLDCFRYYVSTYWAKHFITKKNNYD